MIMLHDAGEYPPLDSGEDLRAHVLWVKGGRVLAEVQHTGKHAHGLAPLKGLILLEGHGRLETVLEPSPLAAPFVTVWEDGDVVCEANAMYV